MSSVALREDGEDKTDAPAEPLCDLTRASVLADEEGRVAVLSDRAEVRSRPDEGREGGSWEQNRRRMSDRGSPDRDRRLGLTRGRRAVGQGKGQGLGELLGQAE